MIKPNFLRVMLLFTMTLLTGCSTIQPKGGLPEQGGRQPAFSNELFDTVLREHVDEYGRVDYEALHRDPGHLDDYYRLIATVSPDSHPGLFPDESARLAYWINAYNAAAMKTVITYYPIDSVLDVKPPALLIFMPDTAGFFLFQKPVFGRKKASLYYLENKVIRKRFMEPRIHFALNCASIGCPRLPRTAFSKERLDEQLDRETRLFLAEDRNFHIDYDGEAVFLSEIFDWYEKDFTDWLNAHHGVENSTLLDYIEIYLPPDKANKLRKVKDRFRVRFTPYDWSLNDMK